MLPQLLPRLGASVSVSVATTSITLSNPIPAPTNKPDSQLQARFANVHQTAIEVQIKNRVHSA